METAYPKLRTYTPLLLATFEFRGVAAARPLLEALDLLRQLNASNRRRLPADPPLGSCDRAGVGSSSEKTM
jgi:hypothetical protein